LTSLYHRVYVYLVPSHWMYHLVLDNWHTEATFSSMRLAFQQLFYDETLGYFDLVHAKGIDCFNVSKYCTPKTKLHMYIAIVTITYSLSIWLRPT